MIPYKSKLKGIKDSDCRNATFESLSPEEKRKEIAYDALKLIMAKIAKPSCGYYWSTPLMLMAAESDNLQKDFQKLTSCTVCQRGLMMVSTIRLSAGIRYTDKIDKGPFFDSDKDQSYFSRDSFSQMEGEYETGRQHPYKPNTREKLANICCNVIANGDFNSTDETDYLKKWNILQPKKQKCLVQI